MKTLVWTQAQILAKRVEDTWVIEFEFWSSKSSLELLSLSRGKNVNLAKNLVRTWVVNAFESSQSS